MFHYWGYIIEHEAMDIYGRYFQSPLGPMDDDRRESEQYTGVEDEGGNEIYEGDIVLKEFKNAGIDFKCRDIIKIPECYTFTFSGFDPREKYRIIGNIHQNPKLL